MKRIVISITIITLLITLLIPTFVSADDGPTPQSLRVPFSVDPTTSGLQIPKGSTIKHLENGETSVTGLNGKTLFKTTDSLSEMVSTPNGPRKASHVYNIPSDSVIKGEGNIAKVYYQDQLILQVIENQKLKSPLPDTDYSDWIEYSYDLSVSNLDYFTALWTVPTNPPSPGSNVINYLFNGIEIYYGLAIIQPVLEWNYGGSGGWTCAAWHAWWYGGFRATNSITASSGDSIRGTMAWTGNQWYISIINNTTGQYSNLYSSIFGTSSLYVFCALEGYNINGDEDVPGDTTFDSMSLKYNTNTVDIDWLEDEDIPAGSGLTYLNVQVYSDSKVKLHTAN